MDLTHKQNTIEFSMQWGGGGWSKPILVALGVDTILTKSSYMQLILFLINSEGPRTIIEMKHAAAAQLFVIAHAQIILAKFLSKSRIQAA